MLYGPIKICFDDHVNCFDSNLVKCHVADGVNMNNEPNINYYLCVTKRIVDFFFLILHGIPN